MQKTSKSPLEATRAQFQGLYIEPDLQIYNPQIEVTAVCMAVFKCGLIPRKCVKDIKESYLGVIPTELRLISK